MRSIDTIMAEGRVRPKRKRRDPVAPVLTALLEDLRAKVLPGKAGAGDAQVLRLADDELRALRATARANDRLLTFAAGFIGGAGLVKRDIWAEYPELAAALNARDRLARAARKGR